MGTLVSYMLTICLSTNDIPNITPLQKLYKATPRLSASTIELDTKEHQCNNQDKEINSFLQVHIFSLYKPNLKEVVVILVLFS